MTVTFDHAQPEADNITTFYFKPPQPVHYTAGQFIQLSLPHQHPDDRGSKRWFTLSSSPSQDLLSITTKFSPKSSTFKATLRQLTPGTELTMSEPMGDFVLPKLIQTPLIFVAGGIGITPFHSMLTWLADTGERRPIQLLYGVRTEDEIVFQPTFDQANITPTIVVGEPSAAWGGERGRITADLILGLTQPADDTLIYVSGPEPMVEALVKDLQNAGVNRQRLVTDDFPGYQHI